MRGTLQGTFPNQVRPMEDFLSKIIEWAKTNPMIAILAVVAFLFFMKDNGGNSWLSLIFNKLKGVASNSQSPAQQQCCTAEGRVAALVHLCQHCEACGDSVAADQLRAALPTLMKECSTTPTTRIH